MASSQSKSGNKKAGRNLRKPSCQRYVNSMRWLSNKVKKLKRHIKSQTVTKRENDGFGRKGIQYCYDEVAKAALKARI